jgi:hypothetical protein
VPLWWWCPANSGDIRVHVVTGDVDGVFDRVRATGVDILEPVHDTDYGSHTFTATDIEEISGPSARIAVRPEPVGFPFPGSIWQSGWRVAACRCTAAR